VRTEIPGLRSRSLLIARSLSDHAEFFRAALAGRYRRRWDVEFCLRQIGARVKSAVLLWQTPGLVFQELCAGFLVDDRIGQSMRQFGQANEALPGT
jgi:hypothetical protein